MDRSRLPRQTAKFHSQNPGHYETPSPTVILTYAALLAAGVFYLLLWTHAISIPSLPLLLWNLLVYLVPSRLVISLDRQTHDALAAGKEDDSMFAVSRTFGAKDEALRRILGLDGTGRIWAYMPASLRSSLPASISIRRSTSTALPGLGNMDNSCYQNSVLQGLSSLPSLADHLNHHLVQGRSDEAAFRQALGGLIEQLNDPKNAGRRLWTPRGLKSMSSWQQQDAQEYYCRIIDELDKESEAASKKLQQSQGLRTLPLLGKSAVGTPQSADVVETSKILTEKTSESSEDLKSDRNPLEGLLAQRVGCLECGLVEGISLIPFNCLSLSPGQIAETSLEACLDTFTSLEEIESVECARCTLQKHRTRLEALLQRADAMPNRKPISSDTETSSVDEEPQKSPDTGQEIRDLAAARLNAVCTALAEEDFSELTLRQKCGIAANASVEVTKTRQAVLARLPQALIVHTNRSLYDEWSGVQHKNHVSIKFPLHLDLAPWSLQPRYDHTTSSSEKGALKESWELDPASSMLGPRMGDGEQLSGSLSAAGYRLCAVVTHYGRHENGHYIAYRRDPHHLTMMEPSKTATDDASENAADDHKPRWWYLSDDDVHLVSQETVLAQGNVFMLFYERVTSQHSVEDHDDFGKTGAMTNEKTKSLSNESHDDERSSLEKEKGAASNDVAQEVPAKEHAPAPVIVEPLS